MSCQGHRHEPYWWMGTRTRCKGTTATKKRVLNRKTLQIDTKVGGRPCAGLVKHGDYCYAHRQR